MSRSSKSLLQDRTNHQGLDHNSLVLDLNLKIQKPIIDRKIVFNYKDKMALLRFKKITSETNELSNCLTNNMPFPKQIKKWTKKLKTYIYRCFKKVRLKKRGPKKCAIFQRKKVAIINKNKLEEEICNEQLSDQQAKENYEKIKNNISKLKSSKNTQQNIWSLKNRFLPKSQPAKPVAKKNIDGQIITNHNELKKLYAEHFSFRMRSRPIVPSLVEYQVQIEKQFENILNITKDQKFEDWSIQDLEKVLKSLKTKQSQDTMGLVNEILMPSNIGSDMKASLLTLFNRVKNNLYIPDIFKDVFITAIPKKHKSPMSLESLRGICLVPKLRSVFIKLVYNSIIGIIEDNLSPSNIGARSNKSPPGTISLCYTQFSTRR